MNSTPQGNGTVHLTSRISYFLHSIPADGGPLLWIIARFGAGNFGCLTPSCLRRGTVGDRDPKKVGGAIPSATLSSPESLLHSDGQR